MPLPVEYVHAGVDAGDAVNGVRVAVEVDAEPVAAPGVGGDQGELVLAARDGVGDDGLLAAAGRLNPALEFKRVADEGRREGVDDVIAGVPRAAGVETGGGVRVSCQRAWDTEANASHVGAVASGPLRAAAGRRRSGGFVQPPVQARQLTLDFALVPACADDVAARAVLEVDPLAVGEGVAVDVQADPVPPDAIVVGNAIVQQQAVRVVAANNVARRGCRPADGV